MAGGDRFLVDGARTFVDDGNKREKLQHPYKDDSMASPACWKCLARPGVSQLSSSISLSVPRASVAAFSTSPTLHAALPPKKTAEQKRLAQRANQAKTLKIKKKAPPKPAGKPPAPGERKAMRKRVVLSNTNALAVSGLEDLTADRVADEAFVGKVLGLGDRTVDTLRAVEAFKPNQGWNLFRRPAYLVREESVVLGEKIAAAEEGKEVLRLVIDGDKGTGKSFLLLHALAVAAVRGWIVINIPEGEF